MADDLFEKLRAETPQNKQFPKNKSDAETPRASAVATTGAAAVKSGAAAEKSAGAAAKGAGAAAKGAGAAAVATSSADAVAKPKAGSAEKTGSFGQNLRVRLQRVDFDTLASNSKVITKAAKKQMVTATKTTPTGKSDSKKKPVVAKKPAATTAAKTTPTVKTPTKAQKKLFTPDLLARAQQLDQPKVKNVRVRIKRMDLAEMMKRSQKRQAAPAVKGRKRKHDVDTPVLAAEKDKKRAKTDKSAVVNQSSSNNSGSKETPKRGRPKLTHKQTSSTVTKPVSKLQLIKLHGKRAFNSYVRIERSHHPLMLTFESNARARRAQSKKSKAKNLSVSFNEQVAIIGVSDTESEVITGDDVDMSSLRMSKTNKPTLLSSAAAAAATPPVVMPKSLKKIDKNGKVIEDIDLDPSIFMGARNASASSTPLMTSNKKKDKILFSPLKSDEEVASARKAELKRANECAPPFSLRKTLAAVDDDDDEEDEDAEYIVPIELPTRRSSHSSQTNSIDRSIVEQLEQQPAAADILVESKKPDNDENVTIDKESQEHLQQPSNESVIATAKDVEKIQQDEQAAADELMRTNTNDENTNKFNTEETASSDSTFASANNGSISMENNANSSVRANEDDAAEQLNNLTVSNMNIVNGGTNGNDLGESLDSSLFDIEMSATPKAPAEKDSTQLSDADFDNFNLSF